MEEKIQSSPFWNNRLVGPTATQTMAEHLITEHGLAHNEVLKLSAAQRLELHNQLHEKLLGGTLIGGR